MTDDATAEILGVHIIGPFATEIIAESAAALQLEATVDDLDVHRARAPDSLGSDGRRGCGGPRAVD